MISLLLPSRKQAHRMLSLLAPTLLTLGLGAQAPAPGDGSTLVVGDPTPPFRVESFLKGEPITTLNKGTVYVIEFWGTWCAPCVEAIPALSRLQAEYAERGVTIVGTNVREIRLDPGGGYVDVFDEQAKQTVEAFVQKLGDRMAYTVAYDGAERFMDNAWMKAAGQEGIPATFIVDRSGRLAWIGHPAVLRMPLDEIVKGTWDYQSGPERVQRAEAAYLEALRLIASDPVKGQEAWSRAAKANPILERDLVSRKFDALLAAGQYAAAFETGQAVLEAAIHDRDATALNKLAWTIADPKVHLPIRDLNLALHAARVANDLTSRSNAGILDTLARVHSLRGDFDLAIEVQSKAVELAAPGIKPALAATLEEYERARDQRE